MKPIRDELPNSSGPQVHLDEARFVVRMSPSPALAPRSVDSGFVYLWSGELGVPLEDAARYATAVAWDEEREIFEPFVATQRYSQFEWGASGATVEFAVELLNSVSTEMVMAGLGYAAAKIRGKVRRDPRPDVLNSARDSSELALEATAAVFGMDRADLEVTSVTAEASVASLRLRGSGQAFEAEVLRLDSGDPVVHVLRTNSAPDDEMSGSSASIAGRRWSLRGLVQRLR